MMEESENENEDLGYEFLISDDLEDVMTLNLTLRSDSNDFHEITEHFYSLLDFNNQYKKLRYKTLGFVLLNLFYLFHSNRSVWIRYSRSTNNYWSSDRYNPENISYRPLMAVIDGLDKLGLIEHKTGVNFPHFKKQSRMRASTILIDLFKTHPKIFNDELLNNASAPESIILKDKNKKKVDYTDSDFTVNSRELLSRYNDILERNFIDISLANFEWQEYGKNVDLTVRYIKFDVLNKFTYRVFNNSSFNEGGRFYGGWWQSVPSIFRSRIVINNKPTVEYDFKAIHVVLLYAISGIDYFRKFGQNVDPYLDEWSVAAFNVSSDQREAYRSLFKTTFMCCINSTGGRAHAKKALTNAVRKDAKLKELKPNIDLALDCFERQHEAVKEHFYSGIGMRLMNIDSKLAEAVIRHFTDVEKLPVLCVHDSFICAKRDDDLMVGLLKGVANEVLAGVDIPISIMTPFKLERSALLNYSDKGTFVTDDLIELFKATDHNLRDRFQLWHNTHRQYSFIFTIPHTVRPAHPI
jgi:hypothetical protein